MDGYNLKNSLLLFPVWCALGSAIALAPLNANDQLSPSRQCTVSLDQLTTDPEEYHISIAKQMGGAVDAELRNFRQHDNWGVALSAAWEEFVLRPIKLELAAQAVPKHEAIVQRVERWLGYVEGRLRLSAPSNWRSVLRGARLPQNNGRPVLPLGFFSDENQCEKLWYDPLARPEEDDNTEYDADRDMLEVPLGVTWKQEPNRVVFTTKNGESTTLDIDRFKWLPLDDFNHFCFARTLWETHGDYEFLAIFRMWSGRFELAALNHKTKDWQWSAEVVGGRVYMGRSGLPDTSHCVTCLVSDETVYVFGHSMYSIYVEGFDLKTGKAQGRFSSSVRLP